MTTIIAGGGVFGSACAFFLQKRGVSKLLILERESAIGVHASGKSGGFIAGGSWGNGVTSELHETSFALHKQVAEELGVASYRTLPTFSVAYRKPTAKSVAVSWVDQLVNVSRMDERTAQVTPLELTTKLLHASGAEVRLNTEVIGVTRDQMGNVTAVKTVNASGESATIDDVQRFVCCMGPWAGIFLEDAFGVSLHMQGITSYSLVYPAQEELEPAALFCAEDSHSCHLEFYPRKDELYVCGVGGGGILGADALRNTKGAIGVDDRRIAAGVRAVSTVTSKVGTEPPRAQACLRPCSNDALPTLSNIPGAANAFVATGGNCWYVRGSAVSDVDVCTPVRGITWSLAAGKAMAELIVDGKSSSINLTAFDVKRFKK
jgi:glycine/D-amino acid oxidase-like deaminating enzyme